MPHHRCHLCKAPLLPSCTLACATVHALPILILGLVLLDFTTYTFLNGVPVATTIGSEITPRHCKQLGQMSASSAGLPRLDMSKRPMVNLTAAQRNVEIGRSRFQLPIAPTSSRARKTRSQIEIGKTGSRDAIPILGLDLTDFQADGEATWLEQPMRSIGFLLRDR